MMLISWTRHRGSEHYPSSFLERFGSEAAAGQSHGSPFTGPPSPGSSLSLGPSYAVLLAASCFAEDFQPWWPVPL
jgi:hypothetical protein